MQLKNYSTKQLIGMGTFILGFFLFLISFSFSSFKMTKEGIDKAITDSVHHAQLYPQLERYIGKTYDTRFGLLADYNKALRRVNIPLENARDWNHIIKTPYEFQIVKYNSSGILSNGIWFWLTFGLMLIGGLYYFYISYKDLPEGIKNNGIFNSKMKDRGWLGYTVGSVLILFYILLYFYPETITNWTIILDPLARNMGGHDASQWFLYGFLYCLAMVVMGVRMIMKYRHSKYQVYRTISVMFFQVAFAFIIPEILVSLNQPAFDFKNMWPLDYTFFYPWRIQEFLGADGKNGFGIFLLIWGIVLFLVVTPIMTFLYGKRWYCSWVCGCGGLAETAGDPFRQLSDKSKMAWNIERITINSVLVIAVVTTLAQLWFIFTGQSSFLGISTFSFQQSYGFLIGAVFSGVVGTGFYPLMGNRVWCRFGCPLAAYMGLVQRFKSRFRITVNGGQCISCGNCSTYCEMGIDVRAYAMQGQNIVRSSCVGCGICAEVCPRGVLKLENGSLEDRIKTNPILIGHDGVVLDINLSRR